MIGLGYFRHPPDAPRGGRVTSGVKPTMVRRHDSKRFSTTSLAVVVSLIMFMPVYLVFINSLKTRARGQFHGGRSADRAAMAELRDGDRERQAGRGLSATACCMPSAATVIGITAVRTGRLRAFAQPHTASTVGSTS